MRDLILVHLVQVDVVLTRAKEPLSRGGDVDPAVAEFPVSLGRRRHCAAQEPGEQLVAETYTREVEVWV
jgi:hypothetical protein